MMAVVTGACVVLLAYGAIAAALFVLQRRILFRPDRTRPDLARVDLARMGMTALRETHVRTPDGLDLLAWYLPPADEAAPVVLYLHGNAGHIGHRGYRLGPFQRLGWGVLMVEYRGFGGNPGHPSEAGLLTDARAALTALREMGFPLSRIVLWGESLGSGLAVRLAVENDVAALLLEAPYTSITAIARARFPFVPVGLLLRDRFDSLAAIDGVRAPVLVMHGAHDTIVPLAMGRAVFAAAPEPKAFWLAEDAGHVDLIEAGAIAAAADFLARRTGREG